MTEVLKGKTLDEARRSVRAIPRPGDRRRPPRSCPRRCEDDADRLEPLTGVKAYPVRVKCATLPWHAFEAALKSGLAGDTVKTE